MMSLPSGDNNFETFQVLINDYESALHEITSELDQVQGEQKAIRNLLKENKQLSTQLNAVLAEKSNQAIEYNKFQDVDLIDNLKLQLSTALKEKDHAIELWQNATKNIDQLEDELKIYQSNTQGLVPKSKVMDIKRMYENKLHDLEETLAKTKKQLEETINLTTKELKIKDKEIVGSLESHDNTFKIVKNLEDEVLNLQERLNEANKYKDLIEKKNKIKEGEIERLKSKTKECRIKVEEALEVVEAALNEKDAALLREAEAKKEIQRLSQSLTELQQTSEEKIKTEVHLTKVDYDTRMGQLEIDLKTAHEKMKIRSLEMDNLLSKCQMLEQEVQKHKLPADEITTSKLLILEKNLENTFQKLLLSEKQNIQLRSERDSIKNDLDQMSQHYERDVQAREAEKIILNRQIKNLQIELDEIKGKLTQSYENVAKLQEQISTLESNYKKELEMTQRSLDSKSSELEERTAEQNKLVEELQEQLKLQVDINKKWRSTTNHITTKFEEKMRDVKAEMVKIKYENRTLVEKVKSANTKISEYRDFLELISKDVGKITAITTTSPTNSTKSVKFQ